MEMSEQINELAAALSKAQGQIEGAKKSSANPFFKSKFADLQSVWEACRKPLTDHGLSVVQSPSSTVLDDGRLRVQVTTLLLHSSGQWIRDSFSVTAKEDSPQAAGSATTYAKRYALQSFAGVAPTEAEDDDGNAASAKGKTVEPKSSKPDGYDDWLDDMEALADEGTEALQSAWKKSGPQLRTYLTTTANATWESMKSRASKVRVTA